MPNDDLIVANQYVLDEEPDDPLPFRDVERLSRFAQSCEKAGQHLGEPEAVFAFLDLVGYRLQLSLKCVFLPSQFLYPCAQIVDGDQFLLIGIDEAVDPFAFAGQLPLELPFPLMVRIRVSRCLQPPVDLAFNQARVLKQANDFRPDNPIQEILANRTFIATWPIGITQASEPGQR